MGKETRNQGCSRSVVPSASKRLPLATSSESFLASTPSIKRAWMHGWRGISHVPVVVTRLAQMGRRQLQIVIRRVRIVNKYFCLCGRSRCFVAIFFCIGFASLLPYFVF